LCTLHDCKLFSEEVYNEYAAQTMFFPSQALQTEKKPDFVFFDFQKSKRCSKKARILKLTSKKPNWQPVATDAMLESALLPRGFQAFPSP